MPDFCFFMNDLTALNNKCLRNQAFSGYRSEGSSSSRDYLTFNGMPKVNCKTLFVTL